MTDYTRHVHLGLPAGSNGAPGRQPTVSCSRISGAIRRAGQAVPVQLAHLAGRTTSIYVDYDRGKIRRIRWYGAEPAAGRHASAPPRSFGPLPPTINFDASETTDPNEERLTYAWDLDGDGAYDDGTGVTISRTHRSRVPQAGLRAPMSWVFR